MKLSIFVIIMFSCFIDNAQVKNNIDSLRKENKNKKIATKSLVGTWFLRDNQEAKIEFIEDEYGITIYPKQHNTPYYFSKYNGRDSVSVYGCAMNWPPYDCILNMININTIEIKTFMYNHKETANTIYIRK